MGTYNPRPGLAVQMCVNDFQSCYSDIVGVHDTGSGLLCKSDALAILPSRGDDIEGGERSRWIDNA